MYIAPLYHSGLKINICKKLIRRDCIEYMFPFFMRKHCKIYHSIESSLTLLQNNFIHDVLFPLCVIQDLLAAAFIFTFRATNVNFLPFQVKMCKYHYMLLHCDL